MREFMTCDDWLKSVPVEISGDLLWKVEACRLALFLADLAWRDATKLTQDRRMFGLSDQRNVSLHEDNVPYVCLPESDAASENLADLLKHVPLPVLTHHASRITPEENHVA